MYGANVKSVEDFVVKLLRHYPRIYPERLSITIETPVTVFGFPSQRLNWTPPQ